MQRTGHHPVTMVETVTLCHAEHELAWTAVGSVEITIGPTVWIVDAARALWIPGGVPHTVAPHADALLLPLFFAADAPLADHPHAVLRTDEVDMLARALVQRTLITPTEAKRARARLRTLISGGPTDVPMPADPRARQVAEALLEDPSRNETLEAWARHVHTSSKTLQRCFATETGLQFPHWRTRVRLQTARKLLQNDQHVQKVASLVGYASSNAFSDAFRRYYGQAPSRLREQS